MLARIFIILLLSLVPFGVNAEIIGTEAYFSKLTTERDSTFEKARSHSLKKVVHVKKVHHVHSRKSVKTIESKVKVSSRAKADKAKHKQARPAMNMRVGDVRKASTAGKVIRIKTLGQAPFGEVSDKEQIKAIRSFGKTPNQTQETLAQKRAGGGEVISVPCGSIITGGMVFRGGKKIRNDILLACHADKDHPDGNPEYVEVALKYTAPDGSFLYQFWKCRNWFGDFTPPTKPPSIEKPPVPITEVPQPPSLPPSISPEIEENVAVVKTTIGGWAGLHTASGWHGHFAGGKATITIPIHTDLGLEEEQVYVGAGVRGEEWHGRSNTSEYKGEGSRFVPAMLVVDWNGPGGVVGKTHAGSLNAGVGGNWMHGKNAATGYFKDQYGKEVHVRLEECERSGRWITCLYAEGNGAFGKIRMESSWSGDTPEKTSSLMVGGSVEYLIDSHWSAKGILEASINDRRAHAQLSVTAALEACYRNRWEGGENFAVACFGPYLRLGEFDGGTYGGTANVFVGKIWSMKVAADKSNAVSFPQEEVQPPASPFIQSSDAVSDEELMNVGQLEQ